jgi:hypothetical protein
MGKMKMAKEAVALKMPPELPKIKVTAVDADPTQYGRTMHVKAPAGINPVDLHEHGASIWTLVQDSVKSLKRFDNVRIIAEDESWMVPDAVVVDADAKSVRLDFKRIVTLSTPSETAQDDHHRIYFDGPDRFVVARKSDGVVLLKGFANIDVAKAEMLKLYARKVGA